MILFIKLAKYWPELMQKWNELDKKMERNYGYLKNINRRINLVSFLFLLIAAVEHLLSFATHYVEISGELGGKMNWNYYYFNIFPQVFHYLPYSPILAIYVHSISVVCTFSWSFNNLLIILFSSILALRFRQITKRLEFYERKVQIFLILNKNSSEKIWRKILRSKNFTK